MVISIICLFLLSFSQSLAMEGKHILGFGSASSFFLFDVDTQQIIKEGKFMHFFKEPDEPDLRERKEPEVF